MEQGFRDNIILREFVGFIVVGIYLFITPVVLAKTVLKDMVKAYGLVRYGALLMTFGLVMLSLPIKMYFRWIFDLKYFV